MRPRSPKASSGSPRATTPDLVVLGGDGREVELIRSRLPHALLTRTHVIGPGRASDGSADQRDDDILRLVHAAVAARSVALLHAFAEEPRARAAHGTLATLAALRRSQVEVLLVHDDPDDDRFAWFSDLPGDVALIRHQLAEPATARAARLVDVAVHAALRTGAGVRILPHVAAIPDDVGAILRWPAT